MLFNMTKQSTRSSQFENAYFFHITGNLKIKLQRMSFVCIKLLYIRKPGY